MREYLPLLIVCAVIGVFTILFLAAYAVLKRKTKAETSERHMSDSEIIKRLLGYARPYKKDFVLVFLIMLVSIAYDVVSPLLVADIQGTIKQSFFDFLPTGTGRATGVGLKGALAQTWGQLKVITEDYDVADADLIYMVNPLDIASYLEDTEVTVQTVFGMTYIKNFLGLYDVLVYSGVERGTVYGTAKNNLILYYTNPRNSDIAKAFDFTTDETGYVGVHHDTTYKNMTTETTAICGIALYAELLDWVVVGAIGAKPAESVTLSQKTMSIGVDETKQLSATVIPAEAGKPTFASSDPTKATVDADTGLVTGVAAGSTNITATVGDKTSAACAVTVAGE